MGNSFTAYYNAKDKHPFGVCSRNLQLKHEDEANAENAYRAINTSTNSSGTTMNVAVILDLIQEHLKGTKALHELDWSQLVSYLESQGFVHQSGGFSDVFIHPSMPYVYKIYETDSAYTDFISFCGKHQNNTALPKIYRTFDIHQIHRRLDRSRHMFKCVKIEKLSKINMDTPLGLFLESADILEIMIPQYNKKIVDVQGVYVLADNHDQMTWDQIYKRLNDQFNLTNIQDVFQIIHELSQQYASHSMDINSNNMMLRGTNQLVISDPMYNDGDYTINYRPSAYRITPISKDNQLKGPIYKK